MLVRLFVIRGSEERREVTYESRADVGKAGTPRLDRLPPEESRRLPKPGESCIYRPKFCETDLPALAASGLMALRIRPRWAVQVACAPSRRDGVPHLKRDDVGDGTESPPHLTASSQLSGTHPKPWGSRDGAFGPRLCLQMQTTVASGAAQLFVRGSGALRIGIDKRQKPNPERASTRLEGANAPLRPLRQRTLQGMRRVMLRRHIFCREGYRATWTAKP
ncbi:hypothetical protein MAPG_02729 [Magnaporthiopsis poae ATCC 64411]|uniref:Uncharacterized protein n=1 Tax=Magnaporthiopsis poae (strain ATCC 64411 / 73-15) TaxID=644358 RepID=A0A0C4DS54_MAGP6|nr:hypothetical protein MAPG_02729 [Magnaporthiopsis poae ATCC 64411]